MLDSKTNIGQQIRSSAYMAEQMRKRIHVLSRVCFVSRYSVAFVVMGEVITRISAIPGGMSES